MLEGQALFHLSFFSYDKFNEVDNDFKFTTTQEMNGIGTEEREMRFSYDQIIDRVMVKEMGKGVRHVEMSFENPIVIS